MPFIVFPSYLVMVLCKNKILETETTHMVYNFPNFFPSSQQNVFKPIFFHSVEELLLNHIWN